jgi:hypothetical protein
MMIATTTAAAIRKMVPRVIALSFRRIDAHLGWIIADEGERVMS